MKSVFRAVLTLGVVVGLSQGFAVSQSFAAHKKEPKCTADGKPCKKGEDCKPENCKPKTP